MVGRGMLLAVAVCLCLLAPQSVLAQAKIAVEVSQSGEAIVGSRLAYQVKENIRRSSRLRLTNINEPRLIIYIVSLDENKERPGNLIAFSYAIVLTLPNAALPFFLRSGVGICGAKRVNEEAESMVSTIESELDEIEKIYGERKNNLK